MGWTRIRASGSVWATVLLVACGGSDGDSQSSAGGGAAGEAGAWETGGAAAGGASGATNTGGVGAAGASGTIQAGAGGAGASGGSTSGGAGSGGEPGGSGGTGADLDCALPNVHCVDDTAGDTQEFEEIQAASDLAEPGDTVLVYPGSYTGFVVEGSGTSGAPITYRGQAAGVLIVTPASTGDGIRLQNVSNVVVERFTVVEPDERCIAARGATPDEPMHNLTVRGNQCQRAELEGMYLSEAADSLVEDNEVDGAGSGGDTRSHCLYLANAGSDGTTIRNNRFHGCRADESNGIHFNGDLSIGGDGVISGLVVEGNVIYDNGQNGLNLDGVQDSVFRNNIVYGNQRNALRAYAIDGAEGPRNLTVVNNTLQADVSGWALKLSEDLGGHLVFNNVLLGAEGAISQPASPDWQSDYNAVSDQLSADGEDSLIPLSEWQALGFDAHSLVGTSQSLFVDAQAGDFALLDGSRAVDAGVEQLGSAVAPDRDAVGTPRPQGAGVDIGALERGL